MSRIHQKKILRPNVREYSVNSSKNKINKFTKYPDEKSCLPNKETQKHRNNKLSEGVNSFLIIFITYTDRKIK